MAVMETVYLAQFETLYGPIRVASTEVGLAYVQLPLVQGRGMAHWLRRYAPTAEIHNSYQPNRTAILQLTEYLAEKRQQFDLPLDLRATNFQHRVYEALQKIPYGEVRTYHDVAKAIGQSSASRAVGNANGANPLPLVIPCHRVVASGGKLGGYGGGLELKEKLLAMERKHPAEGALL